MTLKRKGKEKSGTRLIHSTNLNRFLIIKIIGNKETIMTGIRKIRITIIMTGKLKVNIKISNLGHRMIKIRIRKIIIIMIDIIIIKKEITLLIRKSTVIIKTHSKITNQKMNSNAVNPKISIKNTDLEIKKTILKKETVRINQIKMFMIKVITRIKIEIEKGIPVKTQRSTKTGNTEIKIKEINTKGIIITIIHLKVLVIKSMGRIAGNRVQVNGIIGTIGTVKNRIPIKKETTKSSKIQIGRVVKISGVKIKKKMNIKGVVSKREKMKAIQSRGKEKSDIQVNVIKS